MKLPNTSNARLAVTTQTLNAPPNAPNTSGLMAPLRTSYDEEPSLGEELAAEMDANKEGVFRDARSYLQVGMIAEDCIQMIWMRRGADLGICRQFIVDAVTKAAKQIEIKKAERTAARLGEEV
jgi:hypothetical protein